VFFYLQAAINLIVVWKILADYVETDDVDFKAENGLIVGVDFDSGEIRPALPWTGPNVGRHPRHGGTAAIDAVTSARLRRHGRSPRAPVRFAWFGAWARLNCDRVARPARRRAGGDATFEGPAERALAGRWPLRPRGALGGAATNPIGWGRRALPGARPGTSRTSQLDDVMRAATISPAERLRTENM
jgi:hypothetical protein